MIYEQLFRQSEKQNSRAALIGTGSYGLSLLAQAESTPRLEIAVICDQDAEAGRKACVEAGIAPEQVEICDTVQAARRALDKGNRPLVPDSSLIWDLPVDTVVECTGDPEAGAFHALAAIEAGLNVAMVTKEADCIVGPELAALARGQGVVYTPVDGDQHGLLIGMVEWARTLGFQVVAGGKSSENDFVLSPDGSAVTKGRWKADLESPASAVLARIGGGDNVADRVRARQEALGDPPTSKTPDFGELVIAANHTGLMPDRPELHGPVLRQVEVPYVFCTQDEGGILGRSGVIDVFGCLRTPDEAGFMGGEFIVVACTNDYVRRFLRAKGLMMNAAGTVGFIPKPVHLLGVETPISILVAATAGLSTGGTDVQPRVDMIGRALAPASAGTVITAEILHLGELLQPLMVPAVREEVDTSLPLYMASGVELIRDLEEGETLTWSHVKEPEGSTLWRLRRNQQRRFRL